MPSLFLFNLLGVPIGPHIWLDERPCNRPT